MRRVKTSCDKRLQKMFKISIPSVFFFNEEIHSCIVYTEPNLWLVALLSCFEGCTNIFVFAPPRLKTLKVSDPSLVHNSGFVTRYLVTNSQVQLVLRIKILLNAIKAVYMFQKLKIQWKKWLIWFNFLLHGMLPKHTMNNVHIHKK